MDSNPSSDEEFISKKGWGKFLIYSKSNNEKFDKFFVN